MFVIIGVVIGIVEFIVAVVGVAECRVDKEEFEFFKDGVGVGGVEGAGHCFLTMPARLGEKDNIDPFLVSQQHSLQFLPTHQRNGTRSSEHGKPIATTGVVCTATLLCPASSIVVVTVAIVVVFGDFD